MSPARAQTTVELKDGATIVVRSIEAADRAEFLRTFERIGPESRYLRFLSPVTRLSEAQIDYLTKIDHRDHDALIAYELASGHGTAIARFVRNRADPLSAEAAVVVVDEWQGRGVGKALTRLLADRARAVGIERFEATLLARNASMFALLEAIGPIRVLSSSGGTVAIELALPERGIGEHMTGVLRAVASGGFELLHPAAAQDRQNPR